MRKVIIGFHERVVFQHTHVERGLPEIEGPGHGDIDHVVVQIRRPAFFENLLDIMQQIFGQKQLQYVG